MRKALVVAIIICAVITAIYPSSVDAQAPDPSVALVSIDTVGCENFSFRITWSGTSSAIINGRYFLEVSANGQLYMDYVRSRTLIPGTSTFTFPLFDASNSRGLQTASFPIPAGTPVLLRLGFLNFFQTEIVSMTEVLVDGCDTGNIISINNCDSLPYTGGPSACPMAAMPAPIGYPNTGEFSISTASPVMAYDSAGGSPVRVADGAALFLPNDADGNGFDTYVITGSSEINGVLWYGFFMGNYDQYLWVMADDVTRTR